VRRRPRVFAFVSLPVDNCHSHLCSLGGNQLCGLDNHGRGTYTSEGITKLCEGLKGSAVTSLEYAAALCSPFCQRPLTRYSLTIPTPHPSLDSLYHNHIGDKGASALAAILKETQITNLGCAAARVFAFVSTPIDAPTLSPFPTLPLAHRLRGNNIGAEGASALAAILKETQITNLECAAAPECLLFCQCPLTRLLSHHPHPTPHSQSRTQRHRIRGRLRARRHSQGDEDHDCGAQVRRRS
jgi:hypothetical protein